MALFDRAFLASVIFVVEGAVFVAEVLEEARNRCRDRGVWRP